jgi:methylase of polypeptide subunit release factors
MIKALDELRVLDPACGSGAFPIGMMQLLVKVYGRLEARFDSHKAKLGIIERNLFGVDIEPMAVEISRLRAWLALIVDADSSATNVRPLPNLDFKFVCANTLLHLEGKGQLTFFEDHDLDSKLQDIREQYFSTQSGIKKAKLKSSYLELSAEELTQFGESKRTKQIKSFKPFEADTSAEFFDAEQMFGVSDFQVIIGNPPYVNIEKVNPAIKAIIGKYKTAFQKYDLYVLFYERALELLSPGGVLSYITSNKFLSQPYGELLREELLKYKIVNLINFNLDIFESVKRLFDIENPNHSPSFTELRTVVKREL